MAYLLSIAHIRWSRFSPPPIRIYLGISNQFSRITTAAIGCALLLELPLERRLHGWRKQRQPLFGREPPRACRGLQIPLAAALDGRHSRAIVLDGNGLHDHAALAVACGCLDHPERQQHWLLDIARNGDAD